MTNYFSDCKKEKRNRRGREIKGRSKREKSDSANHSIGFQTYTLYAMHHKYISSI